MTRTDAFDFLPGVRGALAQSLTLLARLNIREQVLDYIGQHPESTLHFPAFIPNKAVTHLLPSWAEAGSFAEQLLILHLRAGSANRVDVQLAPATVTSEVNVSEEGSDTTGSDDGAGTLTLNARQLRQFADDPDDMRRQLQGLAGAAGANPSSAIMRIDGFQNASALPPKSSIASVRVNPYLFSSEYQFPPFGDGHLAFSG